MSWQVIDGDCTAVMREMPAASVDAIVTDPPYGLEFMGKAWDKLQTAQWRGETEAWEAEHPADHIAHRLSRGPRYGAEPQAMQAWHYAWALEAIRVLKPGGHLLSFGGTRTYHRLVSALEDAGFEVRDCLAWLYGSGFPKSLNVSKAIDRAAGADREPDAYTGPNRLNRVFGDGMGGGLTLERGAPATPEAERWEGWGTALKPAFEPIVLARRPLEGTVAGNVLTHGTGALNIDGARIESSETWDANELPGARDGVTWGGALNARRSGSHPGGRWPANVIVDPEAAAMIDAATGDLGTSAGASDGVWGTHGIYQPSAGFGEQRDVGYGDAGGASRFFYTAKAAPGERERGVAEYGEAEVNPDAGVRYTSEAGDGRPDPEVKPVSRRNDHPTVKPIELMQWLCRLVTPPGGWVLDPFVGSGTTVIAALREGFHAVGIEKDPRYASIARARVQGDAPLFNIPGELA